MKRTLIVICLLFGGIGLFFLIRMMGNQALEKTLTPAIPDTPVSSGLTPTMELANDVWSHKVSWKDVIEQKTEASQTNPLALKDLAFAQSYLGRMGDAEASLDLYCQKMPEDGACKKIEYVFDIEPPVDNAGKPLTGVSFEVLGKPSSQISLTKEGSVPYVTYKNTVVRTKLAKKGYTDFVSKTSYMAWSDDVKQKEDVQMSPVMIPANATVTRKSSEGFEAKTDNYTFTVQPDSFVYADGTPVDGMITVYFFDLTADTPSMYASSLLSLDSFDESSQTNLGEAMVTYGMPLVKAYKGERELYVKKPITGVGRMSHLESFKKENGLEKIDFAAVPKMIDIDLAKAEQYGLPPFWQYKKRTGAWETSTFQVLDDTGLTQFTFSDF